MAKRNHKVVISHPVDGIVRVRRYHDASAARRSFDRQALGYGQRVVLVSFGDVVDSRGTVGRVAADPHPSMSI